MLNRFLSCLIALSSPCLTFAANLPPQAAVELNTVVVSGVQPGPGMWKVSKGDHILWVLGTSSPLPKDIKWKSQDVERTIATSQEVLELPQVAISTNVGFFGQLLLLPSLIGVRNNPDGTKLQDILPPDLYARWSVVKQKYIGRSNKVERWRPIFAALELYDAAIEKTGLTGSEVIQEEVTKAAKRAHVKLTVPQVSLVIDDPKAAIREFKRSALDDTDCFRKTLDRIDIDLATMIARANAWATADLDALRSLPATDQQAACRAAVTETNLARTRGAVDIDARVEQAWLEAASKALENNRTTFAMLPIASLLRVDGYLSVLRAQGFMVEAPDAIEQDTVALARARVQAQ